jgi:hypothetical protein
MRRNRSFGEAFEGVYGESPADLYGRFTAEVTGKAVTAEREIAAAGFAAGEIVQRRSWSTGEPAVSKDGRFVAVPVRSRLEPGRLVVWSTDTEPESAAERKARQRLLARDPEDVPAIRKYPRPKKSVSTLEAVGGRAHESPRWFADGKRLLVTRLEPVGDGSRRSDLFIWNRTTGALRRVTNGAGIRTADPSPEGGRAAGVRCRRGSCDLVLIDLADGTMFTLTRGSPTRTFNRPRWSPDGRTIVVGVQDGSGPWRVALVEGVSEASAAPASLRYVDPADLVNRHSATFLPDGRTLVLVSEKGGIPNLELLDLAGGSTRPLTRVTGAAYFPDPDPRDSTVWFLNEHADGLDVNRIALHDAPSGATVALSPTLAPAARLAAQAADTFPARRVGPVRPYGIGPRQYHVLPGGAWATEGGFGTLLLAGTDPVGRLDWTLQGAFGTRGSWRGAGLGAAWRRFRPALLGDLFYAEHHPSRQGAGTFAPPTLDADYLGATLGASLQRDQGNWGDLGELAVSLGRVRAPGDDATSRRLALAEYHARYALVRGRRYLSASLALHASTGTTRDSAWSRTLGTLSLGAGNARGAVGGALTYGRVSGGAPDLERFLVGGVSPPLFDRSLLSQRVALPAAPVGVRLGSALHAYRAELPKWGVYYAGVGVRGGFRDAFRTVGIEQYIALPPIGIVRLPGVRAGGGLAYTLDEPFRHKTRGYLSVIYRP